MILLYASGFGIHFTWPGGAIDVGFIASLLVPFAILWRYVKRTSEHMDALREFNGVLIKQIEDLKAEPRILRESLRECLNWYEETHAWNQGTTWHVYGYFAFERAKNLLKEGNNASNQATDQTRPS